jgi:hypothetical protein
MGTSTIRCAYGLLYWPGALYPARVEHQPTARPQQPGRFGHPPDRIAPQARPALRDDQVKGRVGQRDSPSVGLHQRKQMPNRSWQRRAVSSWAAVKSTPTGRAPRRASQADR